MITADEIRPVMRDPSVLEVLVIAEDLCVRGDIPRIGPDDSLADVMKFMESYRGEVPVTDDGKLLGVIWPEDVIERYNTEIFMRDMAGHMASAVSPDAGVERFRGAGGAVVAEVPVPPALAGQSIAEADVRRSYGVSVLMVRHTDERGEQSLTTSPAADYRFRSGDVVLIMGAGDRVRRLRVGDWTPDPERDANP